MTALASRRENVERWWQSMPPGGPLAAGWSACRANGSEWARFFQQIDHGWFESASSDLSLSIPVKVRWFTEMLCQPLTVLAALRAAASLPTDEVHVHVVGARNGLDPTTVPGHVPSHGFGAVDMSAALRAATARILYARNCRNSRDRGQRWPRHRHDDTFDAGAAAK